MSAARSGFWSGFKRFLLWDYPRASWQYDVMVALILAFIFLTPRDLFRDQPKPKHVVQVAAEHGTSGFWVEPELLGNLPEASYFEAAQRIIRSQPGGKDRTVIRVEPIYDSEQDLRGFRVYTRP
jgi:hypothetical protein